MRGYKPVLQIAVVSDCNNTACDFAERVNQRGQFAHLFASAKALCEFSQLPMLDLILVDRRQSGFAMTLYGLRSYVRRASCYAVFCGFGSGKGVVPAGVDYSFCSTLTDAELDELLDDVFHALDGDMLNRRWELERRELVFQ